MSPRSSLLQEALAMMTRISSLFAIVGLSLAGAACQSSGGFNTAENDNFNSSYNSTNTASSTDIRSNDKTNVHNNIHSSDLNNPSARSGSDVGSLGNPGSPGGDANMSNGSTNSSGTAIDR
jgi:hypothetical protein